MLFEKADAVRRGRLWGVFRFLLGGEDGQRGQRHDKLLSVHRNAQGDTPLPWCGKRELGEINAIAGWGRHHLGAGCLGALLEDECHRPLPAGFEGGEVRHVRDEFRGDLDDEQAMFEENFEPLTPDGHLGGFLFLLRGGRTHPLTAAGGQQDSPEAEDAPEMPWADSEHDDDLSFRSVQEPIPLGR